jgi:putative methionine-R-sulfoxide reductase with GAF domain
MFEMLTRPIRKRKISGKRTELPFNKEIVTVESKRQQLVDTFITKNSYQGNNINQYALKLLSHLAGVKEISQGAFYISDIIDGKPVIKFLAGFATPDPDISSEILEFGEGFPGQVAKDGRLINISDIPKGYLSIESGLGKSSPASLIIFPVKHNDKVLSVIELASFHKFTQEDEIFFKAISPAIAEQIQKCSKK